MLSRTDVKALEPRAYTSYSRLVNLNIASLHRAGCKVVQVSTLQTGVTRSQTLGRGVEFAELKPYQPGDDTRHMDWRATARRGTPWVRAFESDQQKLVTCIVDQTSNLLFGSEVFTKSLVAAELSALCCWDHMALGYTVQMLVQTDQGLEQCGTATNTAQLTASLRMLSDCNQALRAFQANSIRDDEKLIVDELSRQTQRQDVYWFSSATQWQSSSVKALAMLGRLHNIHLVLIDDPLDTELDQLKGFDALGCSGQRLRTSHYSDAELTGAGKARMRDIQEVITQLISMGVGVYQASSCHDVVAQYQAHRGFGRFEV